LKLFDISNELVAIELDLEKANTVFDEVYSGHLTEREPDVMWLKHNYHNIGTLLHVVNDYTRKAREAVKKLDKVINRQCKPSGEALKANNAMCDMTEKAIQRAMEINYIADMEAYMAERHPNESPNEFNAEQLYNFGLRMHTAGFLLGVARTLEERRGKIA
jgi:hypothetical protein